MTAFRVCTDYHTTMHRICSQRINDCVIQPLYSKSYAIWRITSGLVWYHRYVGVIGLWRHWIRCQTNSHSFFNWFQRTCGRTSALAPNIQEVAFLQEHAPCEVGLYLTFYYSDMLHSLSTRVCVKKIFSGSEKARLMGHVYNRLRNCDDDRVWVFQSNQRINFRKQ